MANIKSAAKRAKRSVVQREVNRRNKSNLKAAIKRARGLKGGSEADIRKGIARLSSDLDRAVYKGVLHKNAAARHKQRISNALRPQGKG
ncbi:MAG TPA: 30S ribosomal protein S20 [Acidobacteriota bacterium]|jgi:small subunit ribosomal protein S20